MDTYYLLQTNLDLRKMLVTPNIFLKIKILSYFKQEKFLITYLYQWLEIKPYGLGSRIREVEAFWYKTEIKKIYFVFDCVDCVLLYGLHWP